MGVNEYGKESMEYKLRTYIQDEAKNVVKSKISYH
jgi:hypothetical protein